MKICLLNMGSLVVSNLNVLTNKFNVLYSDVLNFNKSKIKNTIQRVYTPIDWRASMVIELLQGLEGTIDMGLNLEEMKWMMEDVCVND